MGLPFSTYQTPAKNMLTFLLPYKHHCLLLFAFLLFLLYLFPSLPLRTSEDECGNRDREVLGQSLGAAGRMHWAVVGGAASVGKGRPGPISTQREEDRGPIWTQAVRNVPIRMKPESQRGRKRRTQQQPTPQHCNKV